MQLLKCAACAAKDAHIASLEKRLEGLERSFLALADIRAHNARYRGEVSQTPAGPLPPNLSSPALVREDIYTPSMTAEQIEKLFRRDPEEPA